MTLSQKALAAALLCGAIGFALPSYAADYGSAPTNPSSTAGTAEKSSTDATNTKSTSAKETKETKKAVRPRRTASRASAGGDDHAIVEALNKKSLDAVQSGQTPDFASVEPATNRQAQTTKVSTKAVVRHRATTKAKKGA